MDDELLRWNFWSHLRFLRLPPVQTYASFSPLPTVLRVCCCASSWKYRVFGFGYGEGSIRAGARIFKKNLEI